MVIQSMDAVSDVIESSSTVTQITQTQIEEWMTAYVANLCGIKVEKISRSVQLSKYGLDSASAVTLCGDMMDWLKLDIDPSLLYEYPTIEKAAAHIMTMTEGH